VRHGWLLIDITNIPHANKNQNRPTLIPSPAAMGNMFSHSGNHDDAGGSSSGLKRQPSDHAGAAGLKQSIAQNMRLSKSKVTSLLKANHMNYSVVHRNHFYNTLSHVRL
jgi:hypothetical protein